MCRYETVVDKIQNKIEEPLRVGCKVNINFLRHFSFPPRRKWYLRPSWILRSVVWELGTRRFWTTFSPTFKGLIGCPETSFTNYHSALRKMVTETPLWTLCSKRSVYSKFSHTVSVWLVILLFSHLRLGLLVSLLPSFHVSVSSASHSSPPHCIFVWRYNKRQCKPAPALTLLNCMLGPLSLISTGGHFLWHSWTLQGKFQDNILN